MFDDISRRLHCISRRRKIRKCTTTEVDHSRGSQTNAIAVIVVHFAFGELRGPITHLRGASTHVRNVQPRRLGTCRVTLSAKNPKLVKSTAYRTMIDSAEVKTRSWKMYAFKYYDIPNPFPTLTRGLFTRELATDGATKYQIMVRG